jgi:hypothetical protein
MQTIEVKAFPAHRLEGARRAVEQAHARMVRAAAKAGQDAPAAPTVAIVREYVVSVCNKCHCHTEGWAGGKCIGCRQGYLVTYPVLDLEVVCDRPRLAGWDFLAVVEPLEGGNLIRQVPYAEVAEGELNPWRDGAITCDHCRTARRRHETFIVRADGSDPAIPAGTYKQVGRNCLEAFLGGKSAASILAALGWDRIVRGAGEEDEGGGWSRGREVYEPAIFMAWVASVVRIDGWVSKSKAMASGDGQPSTAGTAQYLQTPPYGGGETVKLWEKAREKYEPTAEDIARGKAALEWARALEPKSDYERNLSLVAKQPALDPSHAGILASAVSAHAKVLGEQVKRSQRGRESAHIGAVGDKKRGFGLVTVERIAAIETSYGPLHIHTFRDVVGNAIVWRTGEAHGAPGESFGLVGTVKAHTEFRGEKQTEVTRCKLYRNDQEVK